MIFFWQSLFHDKVIFDAEKLVFVSKKIFLLLLKRFRLSPKNTHNWVTQQEKIKNKSNWKG